MTESMNSRRSIRYEPDEGTIALLDPNFKDAHFAPSMAGLVFRIAWRLRPCPANDAKDFGRRYCTSPDRKTGGFQGGSTMARTDRFDGDISRNDVRQLK